MSSDFIPLSIPHLAGNEWPYIKECLDTGWVSSVGSFVDRFEREFAAKLGSKAAIACSSGTAALHVSLLVAGVKPEDEVIVSTLTFIAPANTIRYVNAWPVFMDAEARYLQMDVEKLADFLENGCRWDGRELHDKTNGRRVSAIVPVHILGHPCDMDPILALAEKFKLAVIEDATESLCSRYKGRPTGTMGRLGCFSFNGNKIITTGSGGMIVTDDLALAKHAKHLTTQAKQDALEFVHDEVGFNYRLSNVSAAFGVAQLEKIDDYKADKRRIAARYDAAFKDLPGIRAPEIAPWAESNEWLYTVRVDPKAFGMDSRALMRRLKESKIESRPLWQPMHRSPAHPDSRAWKCEAADRINAEALSIPCSVGLAAADQDRVISVIRDAGAQGRGRAD
jgi:perosamine synthetase